MSDYTLFPENQASLSSNTNGTHFLSYKDLDNKLTPIGWLWEDWLPKGFLTILAGESGAGKSALALRIAMCITNDLPWPDKSIPQESGLVVWCETEASQSLNLERAKNWGINIKNLLLPLEDATEDISLDNKEHRKRIIEAASKPGVKLLIVDSLSGSSLRNENSTKMLGPLKFLAQLARDKNIAILLIHHLRKKGKMEENSVGVDRLRGSTSIVQTARVIWAMDNPNNSSDYQRLWVIKSNLRKKPTAIGYMLDDSGIRFGPSPCPEQTERFSAKKDAVVFLREMLKDGPCEAQIVYAEASENGIQKRTLDSAKAELGVRSKREGGSTGKWVWYLD